MVAAEVKVPAREYETIYILDPNASGESEQQVNKRVLDVMEKRKGTLLQVENWGRRKLAYSIKKKKRGIFVYLRYAGFNDLVSELERNLRLLDPVVRYQTIKLKDVFDVSSAEVDPEQLKYVAVDTPYDSHVDEASVEEELGMAPRQDRQARAQSQAAQQAEPKGDEAAVAQNASEAGEAAGAETASGSSESGETAASGSKDQDTKGDA